MTFFESISRLFGDWSRKREERQREFVAANVGWSASAPAAAPVDRRPDSEVDREGLQAAFLDRSGKIEYYLDTETGEVVERHGTQAMAPPRYRRIPSRPDTADDEERRLFVQSLDPSPLRQKLAAAHDATAFRALLSEDRAVERRWYVFRNDRASAAVEQWLRTLRQ